MSTLVTHQYHLERIDGIEREKPLPKSLHAFIQQRIMYLLADQVGRDIVMPELDVLVGNGDWLVPDLTVPQADSVYQNGMLETPPQLAIEIMSPRQSFGDLASKCERLIANGTGNCWLIWPQRKLAFHYTLGPVPADESLSFVYRGRAGGAIQTVLVLADLFADVPEGLV